MTTEDRIERYAEALCSVARYPHASVKYESAEKPIKEYFRRLARSIVELEIESNVH